MYKLPDLPYDYSALQPVISSEIMGLHHSKHHQTYVDKLNAALDGVRHEGNLEQLLRNIDQLPEDRRQAVINHGGGHLNHSLFWQFMSPDGGGQPSGKLAAAIEEKHGSFQQFVDSFSEQASGLFGSGWVWLMPDMEILTSPNQNNPIMEGRELPILGLDVWEHAYYLDYKNVRADYIKQWWNVVNWSDIENSYVSGIIS